jgi:hypothetical protein
LIHTPGEAFESRDRVAVIPAQPDTAAVTIPDAHVLLTVEFKRKGSDLVLTGDGHKILVTDYFRHEKQPHLVSPEGPLLSASLVELLSSSATPGQYAQAAALVAHRARRNGQRISNGHTQRRCRRLERGRSGVPGESSRHAAIRRSGSVLPTAARSV